MDIYAETQKKTLQTCIYDLTGTFPFDHMETNPASLSRILNTSGNFALSFEERSRDQSAHPRVIF